MNSGQPASRLRLNLAIIALSLLLTACPPLRTRAEDFLDFKTMYYQEDGDRIEVWAPTFLYQREISPSLSIRIDGIYNSISGATPTGAPPVPAYTTPSVAAPATPSTPSVRPGGGGGEDEDEGEDGGLLLRGGAVPWYSAMTGATPVNPPAPTPTSQQPAPSASAPAPSGTRVPLATFDDERWGGNLEVVRKVGRHAIGAQGSFSTESDYQSVGIALRDGIDFNQRSTTVTLGGAYTYDTIDPANDQPSDNKDTIDLMVGLNQVLTPTALLTLNVVRGTVGGYLSDPYKVAEVNGVLLPERRPDNKDKNIAYASLTQFIAALNGSIEGSYRYYDDTFGVDAHTLTLAWHQKLGAHWILRPMVRYYDQAAADFYAVRFSGNPEFYSADYRISSMTAVGYGMKAVWMPNTRLTLDAGCERYEQSGKDSETPDEVYPSASIVIVGARICL